jgi:hypothetical protein
MMRSQGALGPEGSIYFIIKIPKFALRLASISGVPVLLFFSQSPNKTDVRKWVLGSEDCPLP